MYNPVDFNKNNLFLRFNGWIEWAYKQFSDKHEGIPMGNIDEISDEWKKFQFSYENILIHANSIFINIKGMKLLERICINQYKKFHNQIVLEGDKLIYWSPTIVDMLSKVSPILSSIKYIQDRSIQLIGKKLKLSLPNNMFKVIKGGSNKYKIDINIFRIIRRYWSKSGKFIKNFRDIDQHHFCLTTQSTLQLQPEKKIIILLPDNPGVKKIEEFNYEKKIDAIRYLEKSFFNLHDYIEEIAAYFGFNQVRFSNSISLGNYGDLMGKKGTIALMITDLKEFNAIHISHENGRLKFHSTQPK